MMHVTRSLFKAGLFSILVAVGTPVFAQQAFVAPTDREGTVPEDKANTVVRAINVVVDPQAAYTKTL